MFFLAKSENISESRRFSRTNYLAASLAAIISASVVERAIVFCNRLVQDTAPSANTAIKPVVELPVTIFTAKSASLKSLVRQNLQYT